MRLLWLKLTGFGRFRDKATLRRSSKVLALMGPNEAGKSTVLQALGMIGNDHPLEDSVAYTGTGGAVAEECSIEVQFSLDPSETADAQLEPNSKMTVLRSVKGPRSFTFVPAPPPRDLTARRNCRETMYRLTAETALCEALEPENPGNVSGMFKQIGAALKSDAPDLKFSSNQKKTLRSRIEQAQLPDELSHHYEALRLVEKHLDDEATPTASKFAGEKLRSRVPRVWPFTEEHRKLKGEYTIRELEDPPGSALSALAAFAGLDLSQAAEQIKRGQSLSALLEKPNQRLRERLLIDWRQSSLTLHLEESQSQFKIQVREADGLYTPLSRRSEGFRQFLALKLFTLENRDIGNAPILVLDEAETRLHYDAQHDLVNMLSAQEIFDTVVYTTHSLGCLPENLAGVKLVQRGEESSTLENKFWKHGQGFLPLLARVGAASLSFIPTRPTVLVEGPTDMLLLPLLFKEVTGEIDVGFMVAHGLSEDIPWAADTTSRLGAQLAFLTDSDEGGERISQTLQGRGTPKGACFKLSPRPDISIESLILESVLLAALKNHARNFFPAKLTDEFDFMSSVEDACKLLGVELDSVKTDLAYNILDLKSENPELEVVRDEHNEELRELHRCLTVFFAGE